MDRRRRGLEADGKGNAIVTLRNKYEVENENKIKANRGHLAGFTFHSTYIPHNIIYRHVMVYCIFLCISVFSRLSDVTNLSPPCRCRVTSPRCRGRMTSLTSVSRLYDVTHLCAAAA